ncbi:MAG: hypothetical protein MI919_02675, partial [Holophagales bacterium]|nr:hypothetical protein [Holophagales bacterium]
DDGDDGTWCPRTPGYWKNHTDAWPVDALELGGAIYGVNDLLYFLNYGGPDASSKLTRHLVATEMNLAMGSDPAAIAQTVADAHDFLEEHPPATNPQGADKNQALALKDDLDDYNNASCPDDDGSGGDVGDADDSPPGPGGFDNSGGPGSAGSRG